MDWSRTFIVGGGESAKNLDYDRIRGRGVILGINEIPFLHRCDAFFTLDYSWCCTVTNKLFALSKTGCEIHLCQKFGDGRKWPQIPGAFRWDRMVSPCGEVSFKEGVLSSGIGGAARSGLTGINLAVQKGAKRIDLLGFDMHKDNYNYSYSDEKLVVYNVDKMLENFRLASIQYKAHGIEINNVNPTSAIECFPKMTMDQMYMGSVGLEVP